MTVNNTKSRNNTKSGIENLDETIIALNDIREKLLSIEDKSLATEILDLLSTSSNLLTAQTEIITKLETSEAKLREVNNELFSRVTVDTLKPLPSKTVTYENIERDLDNIIDNI